MSLLKVSRSIFNRIRCISTTQSTQCNWKDIYEPDYLSSYEPDIPELPPMNIQLKGYDFSVLEYYQKHVHKMAEALDVDIEDCWATPPQQLKVKKFKPSSSVVDFEYDLSLYERNIQIVNTPSTRYAMLLRLLQETLPEGVTLNVLESTQEHQNIRYVPDMELLNLKQQLQDMSQPISKKKKK